MSAQIEQALAALNDDQRAAALAVTHALVTACPGSGKTKMLSVKAAHLLTTPEHRVCIVTFSKDSAEELKERTESLLDGVPNATARLRAGTFHGLCFKMLRSLRSMNISSIISESETMQYARRAAENVGSPMEPGDALKNIEIFRTGMCPEAQKIAAGALAREYLGLLKRNNKFDFTDLVIETLTGLEDGSIKPIAVTHMLVDEYQDTDQLQYRWIQAHAKAGVKVTVVGDDDQAIFSWRFAMGYAGMMRFAEEQDARRIVLGVNYRCHSEILGHAGSLIVYNQNRVAKSLVAHKGPGGRVYAIATQNPRTEGELVAEIFSSFPTGSYSAAVIARTNRALVLIAEHLASAGIPFKAPRSASVLESEEAKIFIDLVDCIATSSKRGIDHALSWAGVSNRELLVLNKAFKWELSVGGKGYLDTLEIEETTLPLWKSFVATFAPLRTRCAANPNDVLLPLESVKTWMDESCRYSSISREASLVIAVQNIIASRKGTLVERLNATRRLAKELADAPDEKRVMLTTMHKSKGLEWDAVHVVRCEEKVCPSKDALVVDEERRLFYVAMTRARRHLSLSYTTINPASRFIAEANITAQQIEADDPLDLRTLIA